VPEDFNVSFTDEIAGDIGVEPCLRSVLVQFGSITRAYDGGDEVPWTVQFEEDVKANTFSEPRLTNSVLSKTGTFLYIALRSASVTLARPTSPVSAATHVCEFRLRLDCLANHINVRRAFHQARARFYYIAKQWSDSARYANPIACRSARHQPGSAPPVSPRRINSQCVRLTVV
jgi:hypothetical protein